MRRVWAGSLTLSLSLSLSRALDVVQVSALDLDMTEEDIDEAMNDIDADGSGEIDKAEFKQWFAQGQSGDDAAARRPTPTQRRQQVGNGGGGEGGGSKIAEIRGRSMMANSLISGLGKRLRHLPPSAALVGDAALGSLLEKYGLDVVPSPGNVMPFRVSDDYQAGRYSVQAHHTPSVDAVEISRPSWIFRASEAELRARADEAFASFDADGSGDIDANELRLLARKLRVRLDEEGAVAAIAAMTGDEESEVVTKEQFAAWYSDAGKAPTPTSAPRSSSGSSGGGGLSAADIAQRLHLRRSGARLADGLGAYMALSFGFTTLPGSGSRRGPPRLMSSMFTREIKVTTVKIKSDGTLVGGK
jgi:Ca2+-binding EF-hand superfamily protein